MPEVFQCLPVRHLVRPVPQFPPVDREVLDDMVRVLGPVTFIEGESVGLLARLPRVIEGIAPEGDVARLDGQPPGR